MTDKKTLKNKNKENKVDPYKTDFDNPEWDDGMFQEAKPALEVLPEEFFEDMKRLRGQRGPQKQPVKIPISLRIDPETLEYFRSEGKGWQIKMNQVLKDYVENQEII